MFDIQTLRAIEANGTNYEPRGRPALTNESAPMALETRVPLALAGVVLAAPFKTRRDPIPDPMAGRGGRTSS